ELNVVRVQENGFPAQLAHADLERDAGPRRRLGKDHSPGLSAERKIGVLAAILFLQSGDMENVIHLRATQLFDTEKIFHASSATTASIACSPSIASDRARFNAGKRRTTAVPAGIVRTPAACRRSTTWSA